MAEDQQQGATPKTPAGQPAFKKGDLVWVVYRKSINWPAKVTAFYPREKKVSYVFFPLMQKNNVFKADSNKVQLFKLEDQLPENAASDLEECFNQARRILEGTPEEEIIAENVQRQEEAAAVNKKAKKSLTTADALKKTPKGGATPKQKQQQHNTSAAGSSGGTPTIAAKPVFKPGDPVIVNTAMGMWPGMFTSFLKGDPNTVNYSLFPREEHPHEIMQAPSSAIMPFPPDQVQQAIQDGRETNTEMLLTALLDVQAYMQERETEKSQKRQSSSGAGVVGTPKEVAPKPRKQHNKVELTPPREVYKRVSLGSSTRLPRGSGAGGGGSANDENVVMASSQKKRGAASMLNNGDGEAASGGGGGAPLAKRRRDGGDEPSEPQAKAIGKLKKAADEMKAAAKSLSPSVALAAASPKAHSPVKQVKSMNSVDKMSKAERERNIHQLGELADKLAAKKKQQQKEKKEQLLLQQQKMEEDKKDKEEDKKDKEEDEKEEDKGEEEEEEEKGEQKAAEDEEEQQQQKSPQHPPSSASPPPTPIDNNNLSTISSSSTSITNAKKTTPSSYELAISEECRAHLAQQWAALGAEWFNRLADVQELVVDFRNNDIFTYPEVEALVSAVQKWVVSAVYEKFGIERFSPLLEMHLISKHILPNVCAYVLSKENECSLQEAENIYGQKRAALAPPSSPPNINGGGGSAAHTNNHGGQQQQKANNSLSTLYEAAQIMEGGNNTKQQNGGGNNDGRSGNNGNGKKE